MSTKLSETQKVELKKLIVMNASDTTLMKRFNITERQLSAYKGKATINRNEIKDTLPKPAKDEDPIPTIVVPISVKDLLESNDEVRVVLQIIK